MVFSANYYVKQEVIFSVNTLVMPRCFDLMLAVLLSTALLTNLDFLSLFLESSMAVDFFSALLSSTLHHSHCTTPTDNKQLHFRKWSAYSRE